MTAQENIRLLRDLFLAMDKPGPESEKTMERILDENIAWIEIPWGKTLHGRDQVIATVKHTWDTGIPSHPLENVFADNEWVCVEYILAGTKTGGEMLFRGGEAQGKLNVPATSVFHVQDGKVDLAREYIDLLTLQQQLGVEPKSAS